MFVCVLRGSAVERTPKTTNRGVGRARRDGAANKNNFPGVDIPIDLELF
jgi:hypothetical protein